MAQEEIQQLTQEQALVFYDSRAWEHMDDRQKVEFQIIQDRLCMPFGDFQKALSNALGHPVFPAQLGTARQNLTDELLTGRPRPSLSDLISMLPPDQRTRILSA